MRKPKMIIFDYGDTLIEETKTSNLRATEALLRRATKNKRGLTAKEITDFSQKLFGEISAYSRENNLEFHEYSFQKLLYETLEIEFDLTPFELECVFRDNYACYSPTPFIKETLAKLQNMDTRTAVISNIMFSREAVKRIINIYLPYNVFEFIIASSEYIVRKPNKMIFDIALNKSGLAPSDVWYCGDNYYADVEGANSSGMFPVWYQKDASNEELTASTPDFPCLNINNWKALTEALEKIETGIMV